MQPVVARRTRKGASMDNRTVRTINIVLGAWLFLSAFLWFHSGAQFTNTWIVGLATAGIAIAGLWAAQARWLNVGLAAWLIVSNWVLPTTSATGWNNFLVGIAILVIAFLPATAAEEQRRRARTRTRPPGEMQPGAQ